MPETGVAERFLGTVQVTTTPVQLSYEAICTGVFPRHALARLLRLLLLWTVQSFTADAAHATEGRQFVLFGLERWIDIGATDVPGSVRCSCVLREAAVAPFFAVSRII